MKVLSVSTLLLGLVLASGAQAGDQRLPTCNSTQDRCAYEVDWGNTTVCLDKANSSACNQSGGNSWYASLGCNSELTNVSCASYYFADEATQNTNVLDSRDTCSGTGFCGWRDGSNKSPSAGVANSSRAKLHSCAANGYTDESGFDTLFECTSGTNSSNSYCTDGVWDGLCTGWLTK